jgi:siderophore synthetase component
MQASPGARRAGRPSAARVLAARACVQSAEAAADPRRARAQTGELAALLQVIVTSAAVMENKCAARPRAGPPLGRTLQQLREQPPWLLAGRAVCLCAEPARRSAAASRVLLRSTGAACRQQRRCRQGARRCALRHSAHSQRGAAAPPAARGPGPRAAARCRAAARARRFNTLERSLDRVPYHIPTLS